MIDNGGEPGDAAIHVTGFDRAVAPTSTAVGAAIVNAIVAEAVALTVDAGVTPRVFASSNIDDGRRDQRTPAGAARMTGAQYGVGKTGTPAFAERGIVEGFYGRPWTHEQRLDMIRFIGERGMNRFVYAPKDDPLMRREWARPYDADDLARIARSPRRASDTASSSSTASHRG